MKKRYLIFACATILLISLLLFFLVRQNRVGNFGYMYSSGGLLYFIETKSDKKVKVYTYNPDTEQLDGIEDSGYPVYTSADYTYCYSEQDGFYKKTESSGEIYPICQNGGNVVEYQNSIYFLSDEENPEKIGTVTILYRFDPALKELQALKTVEQRAFVPENTIGGFLILGGEIYFHDSHRFHRMSLAGENHKIIFTTEDDIFKIDRNGESINLIGRTAEPISGSSVSSFIATVDNQGNMLGYEKAGSDVLSYYKAAYYQEQKNIYYSEYAGKLYAIPAEAPQEFRLIVTLEEENGDVCSLTMVNDRIYVSQKGAICTSKKGYSIYQITEDGESKKIIENGKIV